MLKINLPEITKEENIEDIIISSTVRYGDRYAKPDPLIVAIEGTQEHNYINYGGMSAVFGEQKSRKTFFMSLLMAAATGNTVIDDKLRGYAYGKNHLWIDTEQSKYYTSRIPYRVVRKLGLRAHPENLKVLSIKKYGTDDRIRIIEHFIENTKDLGLVVIDGVRDLVHDFNSLYECTDLINKMMGWVDTTNCHICCALHVNPVKKGEDEKPRGHLGTELQNKVESSIMLEKFRQDRSMSIIKPRDFRDVDISKFGMRIDDKGIPFFVRYEDENEGF